MVSSFLPKFIVCFIRLRSYIIFYLSVIYKSYILQMVFSMLNFISDSGNIIMEVLMKKDYTKLWTLFRSMFVLSACTFGGGFVIVSLMKKKYVEELQWLEEDEMLDVTAITQSAPGPLPVNASVIIGYRIAGIAGSLTAILGTILPPMVIISIISLFYQQFRTNPYISIALQVMRAGVAAVIFDVVLNLAHNVLTTRRILYISMMILAFVAACILDVSAMLIIFTCLGIGILDLIYQAYKEKQGGAV